MNNYSNRLRIQDARVAELYSSGLSTRQVAKEVGLSKTSVLNSLQRSRTPVRGENTPERAQRNEAIRDLRAQGHTIKEIASLVGMSEEGARYALRSMGLGRKRTGRPTNQEMKRECEPEREWRRRS